MNLKERFDIFFSIIEDTRNQSYIKYNLADILFIVMCGILAGCTDIQRIVEFATARINLLKKYLIIDKIPCLNTITRILGIIDPYKLNISIIGIMKHVMARGTKEIEKQIILDGKTICSTATMSDYDAPLHIITALLADMAMSIGQITVQDKSNEIPAVRELLEIVDIKNAIVTMDAMHCQKETLSLIQEKHGDYVVQLKRNQGIFYEDVKLMFDHKIADKSLDYRNEYTRFQTVEKTGGRIETRTCYVLNSVEGFDYRQDWAGLKTIFAVKRKTEYNGKVTTEFSYYLSSIHTIPEKLLEYTRKHWQIESFHWILDVNFREDTCRVHNKKAQENLNILRKIAINIHKTYIEKTKKKNKAISSSMFNCLINEQELENILVTI